MPRKNRRIPNGTTAAPWRRLEDELRYLWARARGHAIPRKTTDRRRQHDQ